jgi:predicted  nucleic acid-binding Zn-ribbon protein
MAGMNGGSRIIDLRTGAAPEADDDLLLTEELPTPPPAPIDTPMAEQYEEEDAAPARSGLVLPLLGGLLSLAWVGGMLWLARASLATLDPVALAEFIAALCVPPALIAVLLILAMRTSRAEAKRFGDVSRAMRAEAASLERTVAALSQTIEANRQHIAEQTTALMAMGDGAISKLSAIGTGMTEQVGVANDHAARLAEAASGAHSSLSVLLAILPRAHGETIDMAKQLDTAGVTATERAAALGAELSALAERGREAEDIAGGAAQKLAAHLARMEATSETAGARLEAVTGEMSAAVDGLLGRTAGAVDEARKGIAAQGDAMLAMLSANQAALDSAGRDSAEALAERIVAIEGQIERLAARLGEQRDASGAMLGELDTGLSAVSAQIEALHSLGIDRTQTLAASISALGGSADAMTEALKTGDVMATSAIGTTERLLTALDAAAREIDETLPDALERLDTRINASRKVVGDAKPELLALVTAAESTHDAIEAIAQVIAGQRTTVDTLSRTLLDTLSSGREKADALGLMVEETIGRTHRFAEEAAPRLVEALLRVRDTASAAADRARETLATVIPEAAMALEKESGAAMRRATDSALTDQIAAIGEAAAAAADAAARASERLTQQMLKIADSTAMVESHIEEARTEREKADKDSFSRRVSLLIEALNSASIDIAKSFSSEVSDSAWAAYLKGDRGVFTRRAVRLLDAGEAREIARLYDSDGEFREQVNRYIHDFEAMLRAILAQRDGSPLGVTLLSSDMGKLYVALAQAIERLRT